MNNFNNDIFQICRTCMKEITDASFFYLDCEPAANTHLTIRQKLHSCMPELDVNVVSNPVICSKCVHNLLSAYEFKKNCLQSEVQINKYIHEVQHTGDVNLVEVVRFQQTDLKNLDIEVKIEDLDSIKVKKEDLERTEDFKYEDLVCGTSAFNNVSECTESTETKYLLKLEKVDTQYVLFNTFDDYNINYNLSAAKENSDTHNSNIAQNCLSGVIEHRDNYSKNLNKTNARFSRYKNLFYYGCFLCNYLTKYKCLFDFHNRIHLTKKNYKCIYKHTDIRTKDFHTTIKKNIKGNNSNKQHLSYHNNLKPNMRTHIVQKSFKCSICDYQCNSKVNLMRHMQLHTGGKPFSCSVCEYQCNNKSKLTDHMRIHMGEKPFSCSVCKYQCNNKSKLTDHMRIHTGEKLFSCSVCKYQCNNKSKLKDHMRIHTGEKPFSCSVCEYRCNIKSNLKKHMRIHMEEELFSCFVCEYQCNNKSKLKDHMRIHTGEKPFSCSVCEYQCNNKSKLKDHMRIHTGEKLFSCSVCEYQCNNKSKLKDHMRIHTGEKPFSCSVCEYRCNIKSNLKKHMRIHMGEKPFSCSICQYQSSRKGDLKRHILIHTGEKPFSCSICEYHCRQKSQLKKHMRIHTEEKPLSCSLCRLHSACTF